MSGGNMTARLAARTVRADHLSPRDRNDRWGTPLGLLADLGRFDLDPCGMPDHPTATRIYTLENGDDGLTDPWSGRVYMNPPYGDKSLTLWLDRMWAHVQAGGTGTALLPVATDTRNWQERVWPRATAIHFYKGRINFLRRDGQNDTRMVSPTASAIVAFGALDADRLAEVEWPGTCVRFLGVPA